MPAKLNHDDIKGLDEFKEELHESCTYLESGSASDTTLIQIAFRVVDEYVQATWEKTINDA